MNPKGWNACLSLIWGGCPDAKWSNRALKPRNHQHHRLWVWFCNEFWEGRQKDKYPPPCPRHDSGVSPRALFTEISISTYYLRGFQPHYPHLPALTCTRRIPEKRINFSIEKNTEKVCQKEPPRTPKIQKIMKSLSREPSWERLGMGAAKNWSPEPSREAPICFLCGKYHASSTLHKIDPGSLSGSCLLPFGLLWAWFWAPKPHTAWKSWFQKVWQNQT